MVYDHLLEKLKSPDVNERRHAVEMIIDITVFDWVRDRSERDISFALPALAVALFDDDEKVRSLAIKAIRIAQQDDAQSVFEIMPSIIDVLFDKKRENIRGDAVVNMRDAVIEGYDISPYENRLSELLLDSNEHVKFGVSDALTYHYASKGEWTKIIALFNHEDKDVRQEAAGTIERLPPKIDPSPIVPELEKLLSDENEEVRLVAARSLIWVVRNAQGLSLAIPVLIEFTSHPKPAMRKNAVWTLGNAIRFHINCYWALPRSDWHILEPAIPALKKALSEKGEDEEIKKSAAGALTLYFVHNAQFKEVENLLKHESPALKYAVLSELGSCDKSDCQVDISPLIPSLVPHISHKNPDVSSIVLMRLTSLIHEKKENIELILQELDKTGADINQTWKLREEIRNVLNGGAILESSKEVEVLQGTAKIEKLTSYLDHPNSVIRAWAAQELAKLDEHLHDISKAIPKLIEKLSDEDVFVRAQAAGAVRFSIDKTTAQNAILQLTALLTEESELVRSNSLYALWNAAKQGTDISTAIPNLKKILSSDTNKELRLSAAMALQYAAETGTDISNAIPELTKALNDEYKHIRTTAAQALKNQITKKSQHPT